MEFLLISLNILTLSLKDDISITSCLLFRVFLKELENCLTSPYKVGQVFVDKVSSVKRLIF